MNAGSKKLTRRPRRSDGARDAVSGQVQPAENVQCAWALDPVETREWLFMALESAGMGSWDWDIETDVVRYLSPFAGEGMTVPQLRSTTGADWFKTTHPDDIPAANAQVQRVRDGEADSFSTVVRMMRPPYNDGDWAWIHSRGKAVRHDVSGRPLRIVGIFEVVTESVRREQSEREREKMLSHAGRLASLAALATSVAHELNQPLAAVTSYLDASTRLLESKRPDLEEIGEAIQRSVAMAEKASEIVRRLRRLLRREQPLQEPIELPGFLHVVRESMAREAASAGVTVDVDRDSAHLTLLGDAVQIEQAIVNLVRNAIEALAGGERRPRHVLLGAKSSRDCVRISVTDNGPGIADTSRLFEPFFTTKLTGTGLGLVIAESIAEVHGGHVELERTGADGSTFVLELPLTGDTERA